MLDVVSIFCLFAALVILTMLVIVDLRVRLLPNVLVLALAIAGFTFHACALFSYDPLEDLLIGALIGGGSLYFIRLIGNMIYKVDTLGLGDVKLMAAGGLWLGSYFILIALIVGAVAGLIHGLGLIGHHWLRKKEVVSLSTFSLPAGPGFIAGLVSVAVFKFWGLGHLGF